MLCQASCRLKLFGFVYIQKLYVALILPVVQLVLIDLKSYCKQEIRSIIMYCNFSNYVYGTVLIIINKLNNHFTGTYVVVASIYITAICYYIIIIEYRKENKDVCNHWLLQDTDQEQRNKNVWYCGIPRRYEKRSCGTAACNANMSDIQGWKGGQFDRLHDDGHRCWCGLAFFFFGFLCFL